MLLADSIYLLTDEFPYDLSGTVQRMLTAGEDPLYVARRLMVIASEDVGLADSQALPLATATYTACQNIGQ